MRGDGSLLLRGQIWYSCHYEHGKQIRESLHTSDREKAERRHVALRRARERQQYQTPAERKVLVSELLDDLLLHLDVRGAASARKARSQLRAVYREMGHRRAADLDTTTIERAQQEWLVAGKAPATVNRRLEMLRQAYRLAERRTPPKILRAPHVPLLRVQNARQGFLSLDEMRRLVAALPDRDVADYVEWLSWTGMRPGEARQITWQMVDLAAGTMTLAAAAAKTRHPRTLALVGPLLEIVERRLAARRLGCDLLFHRTARIGRGPEAPGQPVRDIHRVWHAALVQAGLPLDLRPYDLRRSAIRNLLRSGTHERVAMEISGHRTRSTFDRYNIVDATDVAAAIERVAKEK